VCSLQNLTIVHSPSLPPSPFLSLSFFLFRFISLSLSVSVSVLLSVFPPLSPPLYRYFFSHLWRIGGFAKGERVCPVALVLTLVHDSIVSVFHCVVFFRPACVLLCLCISVYTCTLHNIQGSFEKIKDSLDNIESRALGCDCGISIYMYMHIYTHTLSRDYLQTHRHRHMYTHARARVCVCAQTQEHTTV